MFSLPQELLDNIIDEVGDRATLKSCALVATPFLPPCQRNLFRTFRFRGRSPTSGDAFLKSPHLASYIRELTVEMWDKPSILATVGIVLRLVQNIEHLIVSGKSTLWSRFGNEVSSALLDCLTRPSLLRLDLLHMQRVPAALILASTAIPFVSFFRVFMDSGEEISDQLRNSALIPRLRRLHLPDAGPGICRICDLLLHPKNPSSTEQIKRLDIRMPFQMHF
ncbi:hypothetical protein B0H19DRAFT_1070513 [Mycena capillaripes]|nr:hypothetical protein B0H19DRAFT_1070513 [Mycena capillaripes]